VASTGTLVGRCSRIPPSTKLEVSVISISASRALKCISNSALVKAALSLLKARLASSS